MGTTLAMKVRCPSWISSRLGEPSSARRAASARSACRVVGPDPSVGGDEAGRVGHGGEQLPLGLGLLDGPEPLLALEQQGGQAIHPGLQVGPGPSGQLGLEGADGRLDGVAEDGHRQPSSAGSRSR
jgi:hypothetical protein